MIQLFFQYTQTGETIERKEFTGSEVNLYTRERESVKEKTSRNKRIRLFATCSSKQQIKWAAIVLNDDSALTELRCVRR